MATCVARRHLGIARRAAEIATRLGAQEAEIEEVLLACFASRGPLTYLEGRAALSNLLPAKWEGPVSGAPSTDSIKDDDTLTAFLSYFGTLPLWAANLAEAHPAIIEGHQRIRALVFAEGHATRKLKELVFVCINSADRYGYGIDVHTKASANAGATQAEILEAMGVALLDGGIVTWIEGIHHYLGGGEKY